MARLTPRCALSARWCLSGGLLLIACQGADASNPGTPASGGVPQPVIEAARGGPCVEDSAFMRRNHMLLLKHQRSDTLRAGIRTGKYSLKACVNCHASVTTNSVNASSTDFCLSCHAYSAVKLDCFDCHTSQPQMSTR